jgi:hypothetical protein
MNVGFHVLHPLLLTALKNFGMCRPLYYNSPKISFVKICLTVPRVIYGHNKILVEVTIILIANFILNAPEQAKITSH